MGRLRTPIVSTPFFSLYGKWALFLLPRTSAVHYMASPGALSASSLLESREDTPNFLAPLTYPNPGQSRPNLFHLLDLEKLYKKSLNFDNILYFKVIIFQSITYGICLFQIFFQIEYVLN
jgi:hypothetical protein